MSNVCVQRACEWTALGWGGLVVPEPRPEWCGEGGSGKGVSLLCTLDPITSS